MMKLKNIIWGIVATSVVVFPLVSCDSEKVVDDADIPAGISEFVSTNFPDNDILQVVKDVEGLSTDYDVILDGGVSLTFKKNGEVKDIDGTSKLPDGVIPSKISEYVSTNFPNQVITDWELTDRNQQIGLDNGLELEFNMDGDFLRMDN